MKGGEIKTRFLINQVGDVGFRKSSFEVEMLSRTDCKYGDMISPLPHGAPEVKELLVGYQSRAHFRQVGLGKAVDLPEPPFHTIRSLMKENGHHYVYFH